MPALGGVSAPGGRGGCLLWGCVPCPGGCVPGPGGVCSRGDVCLVQGVSGPGGCAWSGGAWWKPPRDGHCCGRYASYWNALLLINTDWSDSPETTELTNRKT